MSNTIRICHISDLHLSETPNEQSYKEVFSFYKCRKKRESKGVFTTYQLDKMYALCEFVNNNTELFDIILITGDISSSASIDDLTTTKEHIIKENTNYGNWYHNSSVKGVIPCIKHPHIFLLPGNHDRIIPINVSTYQYSDYFNSVFIDFWNPTGNSKRIDLSKISGLENSKKDIYLLKVDFSLKQEDLKLQNVGKGKVYDEILNELNKILCKLRELNEKFILTFHYPPKLDGLSKLLELLDEDKLISLLNQYNIKIIFTGHSHFGTQKIIDGTNIQNLCNDATTSFCDKSSISIYEIDMDNENVIGTKIYSWDEMKSNFVLVTI